MFIEKTKHCVIYLNLDFQIINLLFYKLDFYLQFLTFFFCPILSIPKFIYYLSRESEFRLVTIL
jgi:hypothetical protein